MLDHSGHYSDTNRNQNKASSAYQSWNTAKPTLMQIEQYSLNFALVMLSIIFNYECQIEWSFRYFHITLIHFSSLPRILLLPTPSHTPHSSMKANILRTSNTQPKSKLSMTIQGVVVQLYMITFQPVSVVHSSKYVHEIIISLVIW